MPPKKFFKSKSSSSAKFDKGLSNWLVIVESPSKCAKIESFLGQNYKCISSKGHIRHIPGLKSINSKNNYEPTFEIISEKKGHIEFMRTVIDQFSKTHILLATDDDREGEAIAWHICDVFGLSLDTPRIIFNEITKNAVLKAVETPTKINMNLVRAQHARQILDLLVGFKISPVLWKYLYNDNENSLSAGRCQTPALKLVYENEMERINGKGIQIKYKIIGNFFQRGIDYELNHEYNSGEEVEVFLNKSIGFDYKLTLGSPHISSKTPPIPFNTSRLLQTASNVLGLSPKDTMSYAQTLYQDGYITYMRTDNTKYSDVFLKQANKYIEKTWGSKYVGDLKKIENFDKSNPHEAIRATDIDCKGIEKDGKIASLYRLIWKNTVESCMSVAEYSIVESRITAPEDKYYSYKIETPIFLGWKKVSHKEASNPNKLYIESLMRTKVLLNSVNSSVSFSNIHSHYTEASLINKLEEIGIGRPSTFSTLVETIKERGYVNKEDVPGQKFSCIEYSLMENTIKKNVVEKIAGKENNKLVLQPTGKIITDFLYRYFGELFSYDYTKTMEENLDIITEGSPNMNWYDICKECSETIKKLLVPVSKITKEVYKIDDDHELVFMKYGPVLRSKKTGHQSPGARASPGGVAPSGKRGGKKKDGKKNGKEGQNEEEEEGGQEEESFDYKSVKRDIQIDIEKLKLGGYRVDELVDSCKNDLGKWEGEDLVLKNGKFGLYVEWGENKKSLKDLKKPMEKITREDIECVLNGDYETGDKNPKIVRVINSSCSIRRGRFGMYAYYKPEHLQKPLFLNIKKMNCGYLKSSEEEVMKWLKETYNL